MKITRKMEFAVIDKILKFAIMISSAIFVSMAYLQLLFILHY